MEMVCMEKRTKACMVVACIWSWQCTVISMWLWVLHLMIGLVGGTNSTR